MKRTLMTLLIGAGLAAGIATAAWADWDHHDWDSYWHGHRDTAVIIQEHPEYLQDHVWLQRHHDVDAWLEAHPTYVQQYVTDPYPIVVTHHTRVQHWHRYEDGHWGW